MILNQRSITFDGPCLNSRNFFPLSSIVSTGIMRAVSNIHFTMSMKQHDDSSMLGELQHGSNWFTHGKLENESLEDGGAWSLFLHDCILMLEEPDHNVKHLHFSIVNGKAGRKDFKISTDADILSALDSTVTKCFKSRSLEAFLGFVEASDVAKKA